MIGRGLSIVSAVSLLLEYDECFEPLSADSSFGLSTQQYTMIPMPMPIKTSTAAPTHSQITVLSSDDDSGTPLVIVTEVTAASPANSGTSAVQTWAVYIQESENYY